MRKAYIVVVLFACVMLTLGACEPASAPTPAPTPTPAQASAPPPAPTPTAIEVSAQELYSDYEANQVASDAKYKDKTLIVTGVVESIGKDILDTPYVTLTSGRLYQVWGVQCMFDKKHEPELAMLIKGQTVTVQGKCDGYLVNAILRNCSLVHTAPPTTTAPAPAPTPTPTPSPGYSRSNPVGIGAPLNIKVNSTGGTGNEYEVRLNLLEVIRGTQAWQRIKAANMFNDPPKAGFEYILTRIRFDYLNGPTPDKTFDVSPVWFQVISGKGKEYDHSSVVEPDPSIRASLYPAAAHEGWIVFLVAQDDTSPLMTFGRKYDGTGGIWFRLY